LKYLALAVAACFIATSAFAQDAADHTPGVIVTIDYPGAVASYVWAVNSRGTAVGSYNDAAGITHGFRYAKGKFTNIDYPGSDVFFTAPYGINDSGMIVGAYESDSTGGGACFTLIGGVYAGYQYGFVSSGFFGVNRQGTIVGYLDNGDVASQGFAVFGQHEILINYPGALRTWADGVTSNNVIAGGYRDSNNKSHGFTWQNSSFTAIDYPGATFTVSDAIDDAEEVGGIYFDTAGVEHGFLWNAGVYQTYDVPGATATEINSLSPTGMIAGDYTDASGVVHGYLGK
jgi:hypothetical protein